jgi:hypothetical protein
MFEHKPAYNHIEHTSSFLVLVIHIFVAFDMNALSCPYDPRASILALMAVSQ